MTKLDTLQEVLSFNRARTLSLLDAIEELADPAAALAFRPGPGRAPIAWQFMHIGVTEELFATERLETGKPPSFGEIIPRFRGGSTPDDDTPSPRFVREVLETSRRHLRETLAGFDDSQLSWVPAPLLERGWSLETVLHVLGFHEAHHQGQAHLALNLFKAQSS